MAMENGPFIDVPIKTSIQIGFSIAMFDYQRVMYILWHSDELPPHAGRPLQQQHHSVDDSQPPSPAISSHDRFVFHVWFSHGNYCLVMSK